MVGIAEFMESTISRNYREFTSEDYIRKTRFENLSLISASTALIDLEAGHPAVAAAKINGFETPHGLAAMDALLRQMGLIENS